jgi:UDP-N-acetylenolpyruvoylglucosamine reductase
MQRQRPEAHKRFMLLATASLIVPALARLVTQAQGAMGVVGIPGVVGAVLLVNVFLIAIVVHDLHTR